MMALKDILNDYYGENHPPDSGDIFSFFENYWLTDLDAAAVGTRNQRLQELLEQYGTTGKNGANIFSGFIGQF